MAVSAKVFELEPRQFKPAKNLTVRVPSDKRKQLDYIAKERHWQISDMVNRMIEHFIEEYEKLPKPKQGKFDFGR